MKEIINSDLVDASLAFLTLSRPKCEEYINKNIRNYMFRNFPTEKVSVDTLLYFLPRSLQVESSFDRLDLVKQLADFGLKSNNSQNHFEFFNIFTPESIIPLKENLDNYFKMLQVVKKIKDKHGSLKNVELEFIKPNYDLRIEQIVHVLDYLESHNEQDNFRLSFSDAIKKTNDWDARMRRDHDKKKEREGETKDFILFDNGMRFVELVDKQSYSREGYMMGHCVASYYNSNESYEEQLERYKYLGGQGFNLFGLGVDERRFHNLEYLRRMLGHPKSSKIYSLRTKDNIPLVTVEADGHVIIQIKERFNKSLSRENQVFVDELKRKLPKKSDNTPVTSGPHQVEVVPFKEENSFFDYLTKLLSNIFK